MVIRAVPALSLACVLAFGWTGVAAAPKVVPAAKLAPLCEAHMNMVNQKVDPSALPIKVLQDRMKVGPYVANNAAKKLGGVKVNTVLTGMMEYQDGTSRSAAPFICMGTDKEVGFHYASRPRSDVKDRPIVPVQDCYAKHKDDAGATACIKETVSKSEQELAAAFAAAKTKMAAGSDDLKNLEASETEFLNYRKNSCSVYKAPDATTDAEDFLNACLARVNTMRTAQLTGTAPPTK
jgi:uncharacterized protein YecT (DUF1311 family)